MTYESEVLADSPRGYWKLGEASGNPQDSSGNARHVTAVNGTPTYGQAGPISGTNAILFDGTTENFTVPDQAGLDLGDVFTIEAWVKRGSAGGAIVGKGNGAYCLRMLSTGETLLLSSDTAEIVQSTIAVPSTGWHHIVATKSGATCRLYIDSANVTGTVTNATCIDSAFDLVIGGDHGGNQDYFDGTIGQVAVYATALSSTRVSVHYAAASVIVPVWTTPADSVAMGTTPQLQFTSPASSLPQHFQLQLDTVNTFNSGSLRTVDSTVSQSGWTYYNGSSFVALPSSGLPAASSGAEIRYTVSPALAAGTWYRRVRAGT
jgi:hypothetical protein